jgi:hypothetical protein
MTDYILKKFNQPQKNVQYAFSVISVSAQKAGDMLGNKLKEKQLKIDEKSIAINIFVILMMLAVSVPLPFINSFYITLLLLWFLIVFGNALV